MASKKIIAVFGATGNQGGSVIKSILGDPKMRDAWTVRAITRDVSKPAAQALKNDGAQVVAADMNDASTLGPALRDAYAVFAVTNYWETLKKEVEVTQGKAMADAAKQANVSHFIWSSLPDVAKMTKGALSHVEHFDSKAEVGEYIKKIGLPYTFFLPGYFISNIPGGVVRQMPPNNTWTFSLPIPSSTQIPYLDPTVDTGKFVKGILLHRDQTLGKNIYGATEYLTIDEIVKQFKEQFAKAGKDAKFVEIPHQAFKDAMGKAGLPEYAREEVLQNMRLMAEFGYYGGADLGESLAILDEKSTTWKEYMLRAKPFEGLQ